MQIKVNIPDEIAAQVEALGLTPEGFIESLIQRATHVAPLVGRNRNMQEFFREMAAHSDKIPQLPDYAFTRDSFYQDHD